MKKVSMAPRPPKMPMKPKGGKGKGMMGGKGKC